MPKDRVHASNVVSWLQLIAVVPGSCWISMDIWMDHSLPRDQKCWSFLSTSGLWIPILRLSVSF